MIGPNKPLKHKLSLKWIGPVRIAETSFDIVFKVENLSSTSKEIAHALTYNPIGSGTIKPRQFEGAHGASRIPQPVSPTGQGLARISKSRRAI